MGSVDAELFKVLDGGGAKQVASHSRHHENLRAAQAGSDRLIRALASESEVEFLTEDGLAGFGELSGECGEIDVGAAYDCDSRTLCHGPFPWILRRRPSLFRVPERVNGIDEAKRKNHEGHEGTRRKSACLPQERRDNE